MGPEVGGGTSPGGWNSCASWEEDRAAAAPRRAAGASRASWEGDRAAAAEANSTARCTTPAPDRGPGTTGPVRPHSSRSTATRPIERDRRPTPRMAREEWSPPARYRRRTAPRNGSRTTRAAAAPGTPRSHGLTLSSLRLLHVAKRPCEGPSSRLFSTAPVSSQAQPARKNSRCGAAARNLRTRRTSISFLTSKPCRTDG